MATDNIENTEKTTSASTNMTKGKGIDQQNVNGKTSKIESDNALEGVNGKPVGNEDENTSEEANGKTTGNENDNENGLDKSFDEVVEQQRYQRLKFLLQKTSVYAHFLQEKMRQQQESKANAAASSTSEEKDSSKAKKQGKTVEAKTTRTSRRRRRGDEEETDVTTTMAENSTTASPPRKQRRRSGRSAATRTATTSKYQIADYVDEETLANVEAQEKKEDDSDAPALVVDDLGQPALVTGGTLKAYQRKGLAWLISLYENGLNGILADEMGLGKTLQTISFLAFLRGKGVWGPFLIVAPLSTLANWVSEFQRFTPDIPVLLYHGTPPERAELRRKDMCLHGKGSRAPQHVFPIIVTSYDIVMRDRKFLQHFRWKYIVVDEGHRIKNLNCKLIQELKAYTSANRLLLTGTPLQNNLSELWSLLNFLLPDIFDDLAIFQSWFDFTGLEETEGQRRVLNAEAQSSIVTHLHSILKPFLLRRLKTDVELELPKKKEYILYAPMSNEQKELYEAVLRRDIRRVLTEKLVAYYESQPDLLASLAVVTEEKAKPVVIDVEETEEQGRSTRRRRGRAAKTQNYSESFKGEDGMDEGTFLTHLEKAADDRASLNAATRTPITLQTLVRKRINGMRLQYPLMQLRKACNHPYLFHHPDDADEDTEEMDDLDAAERKLDASSEALVRTSGKMMLLDQLLKRLLSEKPRKNGKGGSTRPHKVLIFSQMTGMIDLLEDYCALRRYPCCRLVGDTAQEDRRQMVKDFGADPDLRIFLLSTRAGGLGINLTCADTVIIYDSDWNPQMDLQAQDRVHRIGQTQPVLVYRLATEDSVEKLMLTRASGKRKLEKLVMQKGKFQGDINEALSTVRNASGEFLLDDTDGHDAAKKQSILKELTDVLRSSDGEAIRGAMGSSSTSKDDNMTDFQFFTENEWTRLLDRSDATMLSGKRHDDTAKMETTKDADANITAEQGRRFMEVQEATFYQNAAYDDPLAMSTTSS